MDLFVQLAGILVIVVTAVVIIGLAIDASSSGPWKADEWAAFGQMLSASFSAVALAGIAYGLVYQRQQLLDARKAYEEELAHRDSQLAPDFHESTIALGYDWYSVRDEDDRPLHYSYQIRIRNTGGRAHGVVVCLTGATGHPAPRFNIAYKDIGDMEPRTEAAPFNLYRTIAEEHRHPVERHAQPVLVFSGWQCGPLVIEYVNRDNQRRRATYSFVGRMAGYPQTAGEPRSVFLESDDLVTSAMPAFMSLVQQAHEQARTDYRSPHADPHHQ